MHFIAPSCIPISDWKTLQGQFHNAWFPEAIPTVCPYCHTSAYIQVTPVCSEASYIHSLGMKGYCPGPDCGKGKLIRFFLTDIKSGKQSPRCGAIWMEPEPKVRSLIVSESNLPPGMTNRLHRSYAAAVRNYNSGDWTSSVSASSNVIEGIGKSSFPRSDGKATISKLFSDLSISLRSTPEYATILRPITGLNDALCVSRNPGSHFDTEKDPNQELAAKLLDLVEFLLRYVYLLPGEAQELKKIVSELGPGDEEIQVSDRQNDQSSQSDNQNQQTSQAQ